MRPHTGLLRLALAYAALLLSLSLVVWRQSRALEVLREIDRLRMESAIAEAARSEQTRRIDQLESRKRVVREASSRWGMRVPSREEIVVLPLVELPAGRRVPLAAIRPGTVVMR
jgi:Flp pilus assembly protein TadB